MPETGTRTAITDAAPDETAVRVTWSDGHESRYPFLQLRHQCTCSFCGTPVNAVRGIRLWMIPDDIHPIEIETVDGGLRIVWSDGSHVSTYDAAWLRAACCSEAERERRRPKPMLWDSRIANDLPRADFADAETDPAARLSLLEHVRDRGFCVVAGAPTDAGQAHRMIELVGPQRQTHYGTYSLSKKTAIDNVGDTTSALDPHSDETYRLSTIGITVFQVLHPVQSGGHTTLVDGFEAVRRLRETHPDDVDLLSRVPIPGERRDPAVNSGGREKWYAAALPAVRLDIDGSVIGVRLNERQIAPLDVPYHLIEPTYRALKRLYAIAYDPALRITLPLAAGEGVIFDNQRLLHGRTAYEVEDPPRSVLTSSVDIEEFHASLRSLQEQVRGQASPVRLPQGLVA